MGYLTLNEVPEGRLCRPLFIPDDSGWLALFGGALTELTKSWNYEQYGTLTPEEMAQVCQDVITQWYDEICASCALPDGDRIMRISEDNVWQELVDGTWQEPTGDYYIPPPSARTEPTADERRCLAATNAENALHLMYEELTDAFGESLGTLEALAEWVGFIGAFILPGLGLAVRSLITIGVIAFKEVFDFTEFITADFWDSDFSQNIRCNLYECASDDAGVVTFDFDCVWQKISQQINWIDPTIASAALAGQVLFMLNSIGAQGLNLAGVTTAIEEAECDSCVEGWCYEWDFTVDDGGWSAISGLGSYAAGVGWQRVLSGGTTPSLFIQINLPIPNNIRDFEITYSQTGTSGTVRRLFTWNGSSYVGVSILQTSGAGSNIQTAVVSDTTTSTLTNFAFNWSANNGSGATYTVHKILVRGDFDPNPFGSDNCE